MIATCIANALKFRFVLMDSWFSSEENFDFITGKKKHFIAALKDNRLIALSEEDRKKKRFTRVDELKFPEQTCVRGWLKGYTNEVQCQLGQVAYANAADPKQSCLHGHCRHLQTRVPEHHPQAQPLRALSQATHQRLSLRLCTASVVQGVCVTSVR
jgi:hypothetical protein